MRNIFKHHRLCEDILTEPEKFVIRENTPNETESFRMIEVKTLPNGHVSAQAVIVQKTINSQPMDLESGRLVEKTLAV